MLLNAQKAASLHKLHKSDPTKPFVVNASCLKSTDKSIGIVFVCSLRILYLASSLGTSITTSLSNLFL